MMKCTVLWTISFNSCAVNIIRTADPVLLEYYFWYDNVLTGTISVFFYFRDIITLTFKYNALLIYWKYVCTLKKTNVYFFLVCSGTTHEIVLQKFKFWDIHKNPKFKKTWGQHPVGHSVSPGAHGPRVRWLVSCWISCTRCTSDISGIWFHFLADFGESSSRENTQEKKTKTTTIGVFIMLFNIYW